MKLCLILPFVLLVACADDDCKVEETRCAGSVAQVCSSEKRWVDVVNCDDVAKENDGAWSCQWVANAGHACLPTKEVLH